MAVETRHSSQTVVVVSCHTTVEVESPSWNVEVVSGLLDGGVDGDNLAYGASNLVGSAIVGTATAA